jgi:hypothetical protein
MSKHDRSVAAAEIDHLPVLHSEDESSDDECKVAPAPPADDAYERKLQAMRDAGMPPAMIAYVEREAARIRADTLAAEKTRIDTGRKIQSDAAIGGNVGAHIEACVADYARHEGTSEHYPRVAGGGQSRTLSKNERFRRRVAIQERNERELEAAREKLRAEDRHDEAAALRLQDLPRTLVSMTAQERKKARHDEMAELERMALDRQKARAEAYKRMPPAMRMSRAVVEKRQEELRALWAIMRTTPAQHEERRKQRGLEFAQMLRAVSQYLWAIARDAWCPPAAEGAEAEAHRTVDGEVFGPKTRGAMLFIMAGEAEWTYMEGWMPTLGLKWYTLDDCDARITEAAMTGDTEEARHAIDLWRRVRANIEAYDPETQFTFVTEARNDATHGRGSFARAVHHGHGIMGRDEYSRVFEIKKDGPLKELPYFCVPCGRAIKREMDGKPTKASKGCCVGECRDTPLCSEKCKRKHAVAFHRDAGAPALVRAAKEKAKKAARERTVKEAIGANRGPRDMPIGPDVPEAVYREMARSEKGGGGTKRVRVIDAVTLLLQYKRAVPRRLAEQRVVRREERLRDERERDDFRDLYAYVGALFGDEPGFVPVNPRRAMYGEPGWEKVEKVLAVERELMRRKKAAEEDAAREKKRKARGLAKPATTTAAAPATHTTLLPSKTAELD